MKLLKNKKYLIKIGLISLMIGVFCFYPTFAADNSCGELDKVKTLFVNIGKCSAWLWIVLGNFAGTLMTNTLVYGEFVGLDVFLWKIWQMSRTFANFVLGFLFLFSILKYIFVPSAENPVKLLKNLLVSSVLIQASWFLVMVVIDISTIALATVSSFPSQVIASSVNVKTNMQTQIAQSEILKQYRDNKIVRINAFSDSYSDSNKAFSWTTVDNGGKKLTDTEIIEGLVPKTETLGGAFMYLGFTAIQTLDFVQSGVTSDDDCVVYFTRILSNILFTSGVSILYSLALLILVVILVIRLLYLWVFIAISPIVILLKVTKISVPGNIDFFDLKKMCKLIFQPVIFGVRMSLMFLFIIVMQGFLTVGSGKFGDGTVTFEETKVGDNYRSTLKMSDIFKMNIDQGTRGIQSFILALVTLAFMFYFVKIAVSSSGISGVTKSFTDTVTKTMDSFVKNIGVIPTSKGNLGLGAIWNGSRSPLLDGITSKYGSELDRKDEGRRKEALKMLGFNVDNYINKVTKPQHERLETAAEDISSDSSPSKFKLAVSEVKDENGGIFFSDIKKHIPLWVNSHSDNKFNATFEGILGNQWKDVKGSFAGFNDEKTTEEKETMYNNFFKEGTGIADNFYKNVMKGTSSKSSPLTYDDLNNSNSQYSKAN